jgi:hypothetical protein
MYLAPLNYNRFFDRVFRDTPIAKRFLEDFLNVEITSIEPLPRKHQITDDAALVEFDYRCKINDQFVIIDMQQWYKRDVVKRFYLYFCNNTSLQLEHLKPVTIPMPNGKTYKTKSYDQVEPTITIVWMVDDALNFKEDVISYALFPEMASAFLRDDSLWESSNKEILLNRRAEVLKIMDNKHKNLDFLSTNRLIFMFQPNIIHNLQEQEKYFPWVEFAAKTRNPNNTADDFKKYSKDPIFIQVMEKLKTTVLTHDDFEYVTDFEAYAIGVQNYNDSVRREVMRDIQWEIQQMKKEAEQEKQRAEQEKQEFSNKQVRLIEKLSKKGNSVEAIAELLEIDISVVQSYVNQLNPSN